MIYNTLPVGVNIKYGTNQQDVDRYKPGFVKLAADAYIPLQEVLSLPEGRKAACPMMFGYSSYKVASIPRRNPVDITWR